MNHIQHLGEKRRLRKEIPVPLTVGGYSCIGKVFFSSCIRFMCITFNRSHLTVCIIHIVRTTTHFLFLYGRESLATGIAKVCLVRFAPHPVVDDSDVYVCVIKCN